MEPTKLVTDCFSMISTIDKNMVYLATLLQQSFGTWDEAIKNLLYSMIRDVLTVYNSNQDPMNAGEQLLVMKGGTMILPEDYFKHTVRLTGTDGLGEEVTHEGGLPITIHKNKSFKSSDSEDEPRSAKEKDERDKLASGPYEEETVGYYRVQPSSHGWRRNKVELENDHEAIKRFRLGHDIRKAMYGGSTAKPAIRRLLYLPLTNDDINSHVASYLSSKRNIFSRRNEKTREFTTDGLNTRIRELRDELKDRNERAVMSTLHKKKKRYRHIARMSKSLKKKMDSETSPSEHDKKTIKLFEKYLEENKIGGNEKKLLKKGHSSGRSEKNKMKKKKKMPLLESSEEEEEEEEETIPDVYHSPAGPSLVEREEYSASSSHEAPHAKSPYISSDLHELAYSGHGKSKYDTKSPSRKNKLTFVQYKQACSDTALTYEELVIIMEPLKSYWKEIATLLQLSSEIVAQIDQSKTSNEVKLDSMLDNLINENKICITPSEIDNIMLKIKSGIYENFKVTTLLKELLDSR